MRKTLLSVFLLILFSPFLFSASATGPVFWRVNTRAEIEKGDARSVSIADNGALTLAPVVAEVFDTKQAYIWSAVADTAGNIYLGTGHDGRVFKVDPAGKGALLYKTSELDVMALAVDGQGNVYAGTAPDGKVYRIAPNGEARVFFEPKTKYIWSLAFDAQGRLLIGTGDKGVIFRVNTDGTGAPFIVTTQKNITALKIDGSGNLIVGTDPGGLVLRVAPDGKVFTLFDSSQREVRDLALGRNGEIYALTLAESAGTGSANAATAATPASPAAAGGDEGTVTITISDLQIVDAAAATAATAATSATSPSKSAVYRLDAGGGSETLWDSKDAAAFALAFDADNRVLVGTSQKGRIYRAVAGQKPTLLAQSSEAQTSRFIRVGNQLYAASSNLGKLLKIAGESAASGSYTSSVRDAQMATNWGHVSWIGDGAIELQTRSGNTATPDSTWSDWSAPITAPDGGSVSSPTARFIQWRATLKRTAATPAPRLREVTLSYLPRNIAPHINSITVLAPGVALLAMPQQIVIEGGGDASGEGTTGAANVAQMPPRRTTQRGAVSLQWQAEDRNGDALEYAIFYRNAASPLPDFYPLKANMRENYFTLDANALPDGRYIFKLVVTDALSNPANLVLSDDQETEIVELDNTPPVVTAETPRVTGVTAEVTFRAVDATSIIRRAEYQLDGGGWKSVYPTDGIADSKREEFRFIVALPDAKAHVIAFRAFDAAGNVGSAQTAIR